VVSDLNLDRYPTMDGILSKIELGLQVHLLVVLIGAAYLARAKRRATGT